MTPASLFGRLLQRGNSSVAVLRTFGADFSPKK